MRNSLALAAVLTLAAACGGGSNPGTTTAGSSTGTTSGGGTTGGTSNGGSAPGTPCASDSSCGSGICGATHDGGNCCDSQCTVGDATCGATSCDTKGACVYPSIGLTCQATTCSKAAETLHQCDGLGECFATVQGCDGGNVCNDAGTACGNSCAHSTDCASGFWCSGNSCVGKIDAGACSEADACTSGVCGVTADGGHCCNAQCVTGGLCGASDCDDTGACTYPGSSVVCGGGGPLTCVNGIANDPQVACDGDGGCPAALTECAPFACGTNTCLTQCKGDSDCVTGNFCLLDAGACESQLFVGGCLGDDWCVSGVCGINGTGNCCDIACPASDPPCAATDCDPFNGLCVYPGSETACGSVLESCSGTTQQNASACTADGGCDEAPGTTDCTPFICGAQACFATCTDASQCVAGAVCDTADGECCVPFGDGATVTVDAVLGSDATSCCGYGSAGPCQTIGHAMGLIDSFQAKNVIISASLGGVGGDWLQGVETYPIKLGWGAELSAPGVYFLDRNGSNAEIIDIAAYSANDTVGYASIVGSVGNVVGIGMSSGLNNQLSDSAAIQIENGQTLYLANALVNGSAVDLATAINVAAGGSLVLAQDQSGANTGTVTIGNAGNKLFSDGWQGIVCATATNLGCTITDAWLDGGASSVVIEGQEFVDIDAEDYAKITLTSAPMIGVAPSGAGFDLCPPPAVGGNLHGKPDVSSNGGGAAVALNGKVTMTLANATVQCIAGSAFALATSPSKNGDPSLTLQNTTITNSEWAVTASAGTATLQGSKIEFNFNGVKQTGTGTIDLSNSGSDGGGNAVICSGEQESINFVDGGKNDSPGVDVLNQTAATLDADNVAWDTKGPDLFNCNAALTNCTCANSKCTVAAGGNGMDAVDTSTGAISASNATVSPTASANGCE